jgi:diguanylate cyclase (GGDEF)-like protein
MKKSIKTKVIFQVSGLLTLAMLFITLIVALLIHRQMSDQMEFLLKNNGHDTQQRLEERIRYLVNNSEVLAKNELFINALVDPQGRKTYLPTLSKNFMEGKEVISLSVLDFDGRPIFKTQEDIPDYASSEKLRSALGMGQTDLYLQKLTNNIIVVLPIEYYATTQGALVVVLDTTALAKNVTPYDLPASLRLYHDTNIVFNYSEFPNEAYRDILLEPLIKTPYLSALNLHIKFGLLESAYMGPVKEALMPLIIIGLLFILFGVILSYILAENITRPIVKLYQRVAFSDESEYTRCSPLGSDDELEILAEAFDERSLSLQHLSKYDLLTGLPNRLFFIDRLDNAILRAQRDGSFLAVLSLGLDNFKVINDSMGHTIGDNVLIRISKMLRNQVREIDTIARFGGDEFIILMDGFSEEKMIIDLINQIMDQFKEQMEIEKFRFFLTACIGVALYPQNGDTSESLLKNSDMAMDKAKDEGGDNYQFYTNEMTQAAYDRMHLRNQIQTAIIKEEFVVFYQGQVDMRTGQLSGMEALIRWNHPDEGLITPFKFIDLAEETGLIIEIDRWVMKTAMHRFAHWNKEGYQIGKLSLNLSMLQLKHDDFIDVVADAIRESGINPAQLQFEVTETQIMKDPEESIRMLLELKKLGLTLAIDDFGTGHSSLSYLKRLPIDKIKIDQSFVQGLPDDHYDIQLTNTIISMALNLNFSLIAEGVETAEQADFLLRNGCYEAQGYLYYRPMGWEDLEKKLVKIR